MDRLKKETIKAGSAGVAGAAAGAGTYASIGGVGVAATGSAMAITLIPFMAIGTVLGLTAYGIYRLGKHKGKSHDK